MICNSCKKTIPDNSTFCQHCGSKVSPRSTSANAREWEYKDFVYTYKTTEKYWVQNYTDSDSRREFWQDYQGDILSQLQDWLDQGWQTIGEVGPAGILLRKKKVLALDFLEYVLVVISFGLYLLIAHRPTRIFPVEFRVKMRRPK